MKIFSYFFPQEIAKYNSIYNGEIRVMEFLGKKYLTVGNLEQSGPMMEKMFRKMFYQFLGYGFIKQSKNALLLGLGGGTLVKLLKNINPNLIITGIEIDPQIVRAGRIYLGFDTQALKIIYGDAFVILPKLQKKFDLIIVDLFRGRLIPPELQKDEFLHELKNHLTEQGVVIFNRLYFQKYKVEAENFLDKVTEIFQDVTKEKIFYNLFIKIKVK